MKSLACKPCGWWLIEYILETATRKGGTAALVSRLPETGVVKSGGVTDMTKAEQSLDRTR